MYVIASEKKFRYSGINRELEKNLDQMYGVVASGGHAWAPSFDGGLSNYVSKEDLSSYRNDFSLPSFDE